MHVIPLTVLTLALVPALMPGCGSADGPAATSPPEAAANGGPANTAANTAAGAPANAGTGSATGTNPARPAADPPANPLGRRQTKPETQPTSPAAPAARPATAPPTNTPTTTPGRAPLRDTVTLQAGQFPGVVTIARLGSLDQRIANARLDLGRLRYDARLSATEVSAAGETLAMVAPAGSDLSLVLATVDGMVTRRVIPRIEMDKSWSYSPFRSIRLSPDATRIAINPKARAGQNPAAMFSRMRTDGAMGMQFARPANLVMVYGVDGQLQQVHDGFVDPSWMPDGQSLVMMGDGDGNDYGVYRLDVARERVERLDKDVVLGPASQAAVSPDGSHIAFSINGQIWMVDAAGTTLTPIARSPEHSLAHPTWSPDGAAVAYIKQGRLGSVSAIFIVRLDDPRNEFVHDLRRTAATGEVELFEPTGPLSWTSQ